MTAGVSAVILTKNEEAYIARCLISLKWCDEMLVIDDFSTDKTNMIAAKMGAKVIQHALDGDFSQQRNFGLEKAKNDWILFVDADEEISLSLQYEITHHIGDQFDTYDGFLIKRIDEMWGRKLAHGEVGNVYILRLAKRMNGIWQGKVHEVWKIKGKIGKLQNPMMHYSHPTVQMFLAKINFYSELRAKELFLKHVMTNRWQIIVYPIGKFFVGYIFQFGFLDGLAGLVIALMMSFHSFLVRSKLWLSYESNTEHKEQ